MIFCATKILCRQELFSVSHKVNKIIRKNMTISSIKVCVCKIRIYCNYYWQARTTAAKPYKCDLESKKS